MKKTFRLLGLLAAVLLFGAGLSACGHDDDDGKYINPADFKENDSALVGAWQKTESGNGWSDTEVITFNADGTYSETDVEINGANSKTTWERGSWKTNGLKTQVLFKVDASSDPGDVGEQDVENYKVEAGALTLDRDVYQSVADR